MDPAPIHFQAVEYIYHYFCSTIDKGLHFWQPEPYPTINYANLPSTLSDNHTLNLPKQQYKEPLVFVDADWAGNIKH